MNRSERGKERSLYGEARLNGTLDRGRIEFVTREGRDKHVALRR